MSYKNFGGSFIIFLAILAISGSFVYFFNGFTALDIVYSDLISWFIFHPWIAVVCLLIAQSNYFFGGIEKSVIPSTVNLFFIISFLLSLFIHNSYPKLIPALVIITFVLVLYLSQKNPEKIRNVSLWLGIAFIILYIPLLIGSSNLVP